MRLIHKLGEPMIMTYPDAAVVAVGEEIDAFASELTPGEQLTLSAVLRAKAQKLENNPDVIQLLRDDEGLES